MESRLDGVESDSLKAINNILTDGYQYKTFVCDSTGKQWSFASEFFQGTWQTDNAYRDSLWNSERGQRQQHFNFKVVERMAFMWRSGTT